jgi:multicomponent Na+:H+ antiporter subunit D
VSDWGHPAWPFLAAAVVAALVPRLGRVTLLAGAAVSVALAWRLVPGTELEWPLMAQRLVVAHADALSRVFALIFALFGGLALLYAFPASPRVRIAGAGATAAGIAISLAGDWITLYAAWELLAVASFVLIVDGGTPRARAAAFRYLLVHATGGAMLLAGIVWHVSTGGDLRVGALSVRGPGTLVLLGFAINAAIPPLHAWLTDAYPESSPAGSVFLSAFATKSAVYALARVFPGEELLVWAGAGMAVYGVVFAAIENDIRRLLGYHIVSQVGYMVTGIGLGTALALNGSAAHAFCHILYKGLLFMGAGAVVHATGRRRLSDLGGLGRAMPAVVLLYMIGALSISGAPLLNGFVSKSLVVAGADAAHREVVGWVLTVAAVGTFLSVGLKLPWFAFFAGRAPARATARLPAAMLGAMALTAALCIALGVAPGMLYALLPHPIEYQPYTTAHVVETLELLVATGFVFAVILRLLTVHALVILDADRLYRHAGSAVRWGLAALAARAADVLETGAAVAADVRLARATTAHAARLAYAVLVAVAALGIGLLVAS